MASASSQIGGGAGNNSRDYREQNQTPNNNKQPHHHPLLHEQKQQQSTADNVFSIDRTFSATSTDIQLSFDEEEEDDRICNRNHHRFQSHHPHHHNSHSHEFFLNSKNPGRAAEIRRKEMIGMHHQGQKPHPGNVEVKIKNKSKCNNSETVSANANPSSSSSNIKNGTNPKRNYFIEEDDSSIGVPSDISGMLRDSEAVPEDDTASPEANNNPINSRENPKARKECESDCNNENLKGAGGRTDADTNNRCKNGPSSASIRSSGSGSSNSNALRSAIISDGRFGSINSVSSSFNSAAAAAIGSGSGSGRHNNCSKVKIGAGINNKSYNNNTNNDILNERLERFHRYTRGPYAPLDRCNSTSVSSAHSSTITQHYYPEGGWGYVILTTAAICHALMCGLHLTAGIFLLEILNRFGEDLVFNSGMVLADTIN